MIKRKVLVVLQAIVIGSSLVFIGCTENEESSSGADIVIGQEESNKDINSVFGSIIEKPVLNGSKTERIGTYAEVMAGGVEISEEKLIKFYNEIVKDNEYNWITINIDGEMGIQFSGAAFRYGKIDDEACIVTGVGIGFIVDDKIDYEEVE